MKKPKLKLVGEDGNVFNLLGLARKAARKAGWSDTMWKEVQDKATSGDYDNALRVLMEHFDVY